MKLDSGLTQTNSSAHERLFFFFMRTEINPELHDKCAAPLLAWN